MRVDWSVESWFEMQARQQKTIELGCWSSRLEKLHCMVCRLHVLNNAKILE